MSKTVTLRLNDKNYNLFRQLAENDNRSLANFIETCVLQFIESDKFVNSYEMAEIAANEELNHSLQRAIEDAKAKRGRFVE